MEQTENIGPKHAIRLADLREWHIVTATCFKCGYQNELTACFIRTILAIAPLRYVSEGGIVRFGIDRTVKFQQEVVALKDTVLYRRQPMVCSGSPFGKANAM